MADTPEKRDTEQYRIGLCLICRHALRVKSDRGSEFYSCTLSSTDARFPKYPRLPVFQCEGYAPKA
jgi:hypothetical protein